MTLIELLVGQFDYGHEVGIRAALLGFGVHLTKTDFGGVWRLDIYSEWSFFYRHKSWRWLPAQKGSR